MKFSGKMCLKIILKVIKNQGFTLSLEETFFEKPQGLNMGLCADIGTLGLEFNAVLRLSMHVRIMSI